MTTILVTGGAGFIGSHLTNRLVAEGFEVHVLDNLSSGKAKNVPNGATLHILDIRDADAVEKLFTDFPFNIMFHEAAQMSVIRSVDDPLTDIDVNIRGTVVLLEAGRKNGLTKVIAASSGGVIYGEPVHIPQREDNPLIPMSPYGIAKLAVENYLRFYWEVYHIPYIALRYANVYGPRQNPESGAGVLAIFMEKILHGEQPVINGTGGKTRDYIHIDDVVEANMRAMRYDGVGPINIGTGIETSVNRVFQLVRDLCQIDVTEVHGEEQEGEQLRSVLDIRLAEKLLGWKPTITLEKGLRDTIVWYINEAKNQGKPLIIN